MIELKYAIAMMVAGLCIVMPMYAPIGIKKDSILGVLCVVGTVIEWFLIWYVTVLLQW